MEEESGAVGEIGGVGGGGGGGVRGGGGVEEARELGGGNRVVEDVLPDDKIGGVEKEGNGVHLE